MTHPLSDPVATAKHIGWLEGRIIALESMNASMVGQIKALRRERLALKKQLRSKKP